MWPSCGLKLASAGVDPRRRVASPITRVEIAARSDERYWSYKTMTLYFISRYYRPTAEYCRRSVRRSTRYCLAVYIKQMSDLTWSASWKSVRCEPRHSIWARTAWSGLLDTHMIKYVTARWWQEEFVSSSNVREEYDTAARRVWNF